MFYDKRFLKIEKEVCNINKNVSEIFDKIKSLEKSFERHKEYIYEFQETLMKDNKNDIENRMIDFKKEYYEKYYQTLADIFNFTRVMLLDTKDNRLNGLKAEMLRPYIEQKHKQEKNELGEILLNKGAEIIDKRKQLWDEMLLAEKRGEDTEKMCAELKGFDWILERIKNVSS